jgi:hypothetical protein
VRGGGFWEKHVRDGRHPGGASVSHTLSALLRAGGMFVAMLLLLEAGRRIGRRRARRGVGGAETGAGVVDGAVFALLGLLVAFTFSGAMARFDMRRQLIVDETNAIGTAYLRIDLLSPDARPRLRDSFRRYLDSRLDVYRQLPDVAAAKAALARSLSIQRQLWEEAVAACRLESSTAPTILLLPALNEAIDITTKRTMATEMHPPQIIFVVLIGLALVASLLAGYDMAAAKSRPWLHMLGFAGALSVALYVILDIEYPRLGLIRVDAFDRALIELRESMK